MDKRIVIKIGPGSFETGFAAAVQIGDEGTYAQVETQAALPPAPDLALLYRRWQQSYWDLGLAYRLEARSGVTNVSDVSKIENCRTMSRQLRDRIHHWLNGDDYRPIREKLLEQLSPKDTARIVLQTQDPLLQRLPWYELHFFDRYRQAEVGVCSSDYQQVSYNGTRSKQVRILAVLGDAAGLNTQIDRTLLSQLPNVDIHFLNAPSRETFNHLLWDDQGWDILYFAGHSRSHLSGSQASFQQRDWVSCYEGNGEMALNDTETLTIPQLKHALKKAIERGLNTAIFNSCDGLGLAHDLADLHIPQTLVMREPVPDQVAHAFLQGFLESFAAGHSFYLAVREAREKLQGLEARFPCATWLPVIVQNLAECPPTWQSLQGAGQLAEDDFSVDRDVETTPETDVVRFPNHGIDNHKIDRVRSPQPPWRVALTSVMVIVALLLFGRYFGLLETVEIAAYDHFLRARPPEMLDDRLLIITNSAEDIQSYPNLAGASSLADETLSQLLSKLTPLEPAAIGLDIYRSQAATDPLLKRQLAETDNFIAICKVADHTTDAQAIRPSPDIAPAQRAASDFVEDAVGGGVLRRHLMALEPPPSSLCQAQKTFSTALALSYLTQYHPEHDMEDLAGRLPDIAPNQTRFGGYHNLDAQGYQMMLNYRIVRDPKQTNCGNVRETPADCMRVSDVLTRPAEQFQDFVKDRIVLIGTTDIAYGAADRWLTPYTHQASVIGQTPGVFLQAQMISQLLSFELDNRPLISAWPEWKEGLWIACWAATGGWIGLNWRLRRLAGWLLLAEGGLLLLCWLWFVRMGIWVPWAPSAIALLATALMTTFWPSRRSNLGPFRRL